MRTLIASLIALGSFLFCSATVALAGPGPTPSPPPVQLSGVVSGFWFNSNNPNVCCSLDTANGSDVKNRTELSNALLTISHTTGNIQFKVMAGAYSFPTVGTAINPTFQEFTNTHLYGWVPVAYVQYIPDSHWTVTAGQIPTMLGPENAFTFQNFNIQRGLLWNQEPVMSSGIRVGYTGAKFNAALEFNDGFYSHSWGAIEGSLGWNPDANSSFQFVFFLPNRNTPPNITALVANKRELNLMYSRQFGKLQVQPSLLWVQSPSSPALDYEKTNTLFGGGLLANYQFNPCFSLGGRFEALSANNPTNDFTFNSDLLGFGPGSRATTWTLTPSYWGANFFARGEWSYTAVNNLLSGVGFGANGDRTNQTRYGLELGAKF